MKVIVLSTMKELPANCLDCPFHACSIPLKADGIHIMKNSVKKRNPHCPLKEIEIKED